MNYTQLPDDILPKVRTWSAMQLAIWADVHTMGKAGMIYYRTNEQLAERWQTDERTVRRVVKQLIELGAVTAQQDGRRRILTAVLGFEERRRTKQSTVQADHGPTSPRTNQSAKEDQAVREGGPTGPQKEDQLVPQVEHRVEQEEEQKVEQRATKPKIEIVMPWESDEFADAWRQWKEYKRIEKRFKFKSPNTEQTALHKIHQDAEGNEQLAIYAIGASIAAGWTGLIVSRDIRREFHAKHQPSGEIEFTAEYLQFLKEG
jgi:hypothetical protein